MTFPVHGGVNDTELKSARLVPGGVLDFSANINPLGTAPGVLQAIHGVDPAAANFLLVGAGNAASLRARLLKDHGICVREGTSFGLPGHVRIRVRGLDDCRRLIGALETGFRRHQDIRAYQPCDKAAPDTPE